jgi:molybdopterin/thiamine biosynthesis adenylyltransferase
MAQNGPDISRSSLTEQDLVRYERQILFPAFGEEGQRKLKEAHVLVAGVGGLGSPAAIYLACAGIGKLTLVDYDTVELSNLNRQILHEEADIGEKKVFSADQKLRRINSTVEIIPAVVEVTAESLKGLLEDIDIAIDCLDNMATRFILNEGCIRQGIPLIHGGIYGLMGEITTIIPGQTPCLECIFPPGVEGKKPFPVFGFTPALIASLQVTEAVKLLAGFGELLAGKMLYVRGEEMVFMTVDLQKNTACRVCGGGES